MEKGLLYYKEFIDKLVDMSKSCTDANNIKNGSYPKVAVYQNMNAILEKLSQEERQVLSDSIQSCYSSAVFDVLSYLEWLSCCRNMQISIDGEILSSSTFEGFSDDFIGRSNDWEWPK
ncbi:DUF6547 family protein [uncultured Clostridium sp.]|uniref:DUF6547 family protein n=1 Tax=uncultured Clostridium sp. TaxID=59620 RepID=UPI0028E73969|nr:DUF6547 family protein [uncultured Clostridium sp.]